MGRSKIGFVSCVHPLYDVPGTASRKEAALAALRESGCDVISADVPRSPADAVAEAAALRQAGVDLVVLFFCSWVSEDVTLALARELMDLPIMLWALPYLDRDVPMPSPISGLTSSGSNIRRLGKPFVYAVGTADGAVVDVARAARVAAAVRALGRARFGLIGAPCPGMVDVLVDDQDFEKVFGLTTIHLDLDELLRAAAAAKGEDVARAAGRLTTAAGGRPEIGERALADNLRLYVGIRQLIREHALDGYCVRCWPELRDGHGITPCTAHALTARDGVASTCEVDLPALITTFLLGRLAGESAFNFDITGCLDDGTIQFAHCGAADPALAADSGRVLLRTHMRTRTGATVEFPFRQGRVTLAKLLRPVNGRLRLFVAAGQAVDAGVGVRGSVAAVRPAPSAAAFLDAMMREAVEHHVALVYGDWRRELELFCEFTRVEYVPLPGAK